MKAGLCECKNNTNYNVYKLARIAIMSFRTSEYLDKTLSKYIYCWLLINSMHREI